MSADPVNRSDRRRERTRSALVRAAQRLFAEQGNTGASIQEITEAADVGFGSFYNHFESKAELFDAAVDEALEQHGAWMDKLLANVDDPAEIFAVSLRLTGRLIETNPSLARVFMRSTERLMRSPVGLAPRALRDIERAVEAERFRLDDPEIALACTTGALTAVLLLLEDETDIAHIERATDEMARGVLRMHGMTGDAAAEVVARPLPVSAPPAFL